MPGPLRDQAPILSLVVPVLNEEESIGLFLERAVPSLDAAVGAGGWEIVFVDDGSTDATLGAVLAAHQRLPGVHAVVLSRRFGKEAALSAGLAHARGDAVIPMDVDLQDPPEIIPDMVERWREGAKVVMAVRSARPDDGAMKRLSAGWFYRIYNRMADRPITPNAGDFRLLDRVVVEVLNQLPERNRFMKGLFAWVGYPTAEVGFVREARKEGRSKWKAWSLWNFALDGLTSSSTVALRIWSYFGMLIALVGFVFALVIVAQALIWGNDVPGYASLMVVTLVLGGLNLMSMGILGEYVGRIFVEVKGRPLYVVRETVGFAGGSESLATQAGVAAGVPAGTGSGA